VGSLTLFLRMPSTEMPADDPPPIPSASPPADDPNAGRGLHEPPTGQLILGTDKRNPVFAVYEDDSGQRLLVFYGFELIEIVNNDPEDPARKLLLGRLYNSGVKLRALCERFEVDPKTVRRWGEVLLQGDPGELIRVLEGRRARRKRTVAVEKFARMRWPELVAQGSYGAVGRLQGEIQSVFGVDISRSGLQSLIRELKAATVPLEVPSETAAPESLPLALNPPASRGALGSETLTDASPGPEVEKREMGVSCLAESLADSVSDAALSQGLNDQAMAPPPANTAHPTPFFPKDPRGANYWCDHAGVLIFATALAAVSKVSATAQAILAQWMAALWLGAQNIEQTKFLNWEDLELILGGVVRFPTPQRQELKLLAADTGLIDGLWRFNQQNLGQAVGTDFYFDPHTKHYTGEQNVLKGWCPQIRFADKAMHSDFIHTAQGAPIYFETTDNFADLRQRFLGVVARARQALQWPPEKVLTFIADRGVYGAEFFQKVIADPALHLITWEKGFVAQRWNPDKVMGRTTITRYRNSSTDLRSYQFEYFEGAWEKNPKLRQIVVQATDDKGRTIQVAILTDDPKRAAAEIIKLMFQRWLQENDFKYLDKHFGINQITSYRSIEYEQLKSQVEDREVKSAARKALDLSHKQATEQLKRNLLAEDQALQAHQRRAQKRQELDQQLVKEASASTPQYEALSRQAAVLKSADQRYETARLERRKRLDQNHQQIGEIQAQIEGTKAKESRLEVLIQDQMVRMDSQCKRLMDVLRITARNLFYQALQPFEKAYDNYRDDHDYFRNLTQSPGVLEVSAEQIVIHLLPRTNYGGALRKAVKLALEAINAEGLEHPCLPGRKLKFRLGQRAEMELKMNVGP
jgi:hypothetical protein